MYDYVYIPKDIRELQYIVNNNPELFSCYLRDKSKNSLLVFYYDKIKRRVDNIIQAHDNRRTIEHEYLERSVKNLSDTSYKQLKKIYPNLITPHYIIKY